MSALKEILDLPLHEKLLAMEAIWTDISQKEESLGMPVWHQNELDQRESLIESGKAKFMPWEDAKKQLKGA